MRSALLCALAVSLLLACPGLAAASANFSVFDTTLYEGDTVTVVLTATENVQLRMTVEAGFEGIENAVLFTPLGVDGTTENIHIHFVTLSPAEREQVVPGAYRVRLGAYGADDGLRAYMLVYLVVEEGGLPPSHYAELLALIQQLNNSVDGLQQDLEGKVSSDDLLVIGEDLAAMSLQIDNILLTLENYTGSENFQAENLVQSENFLILENRVALLQEDVENMRAVLMENESIDMVWVYAEVTRLGLVAENMYDEINMLKGGSSTPTTPHQPSDGGVAWEMPAAAVVAFAVLALVVYKILKWLRAPRKHTGPAESGPTPEQAGKLKKLLTGRGLGSTEQVPGVVEGPEGAGARGKRDLSKKLRELSE